MAVKLSDYDKKWQNLRSVLLEKGFDEALKELHKIKASQQEMLFLSNRLFQATMN